MPTSHNTEGSSVYNKASFATSVSEDNWRELLLTNRLKEMIDNTMYDFEHRLLIVNNKQVSVELFAAIDAQIQKGIINQVLFSSVWRGFILQRFGIEQSSEYLLQNLIAIHFCPTEYLFWLSCDCKIANQAPWVDDAIGIMSNDANAVVANLVFDNEFNDSNKTSAEELADFSVSNSFSDQCYLLPVDRYRNEMYSQGHAKNSFEKSISSWIKTKRLKCITHKKISYRRSDFMGVAPEMLFRQKKSRVADWINSGLAFDDIFQRVEADFYNLLESKNFYHYSARCFAQRGDKFNTLESLKMNVKKWPNESFASKRIINSFRSGVVDLNGLKFSLDQDVLSLHMQLVIARGDYEAGELKMLCNYARPNDRVLELGAGVGFIGINYLHQNPDHYYVACEANPHLIELIQKNQALNNINFNVENIIFDDYEGHADFYITEDFWASSLVKPDKYQEKRSIDVKNINSFIEAHQINTLIMDIEGAEYELIKKIDLNNLNKIVLEMHSNVYGVQGMEEIFQHLKRNGFALPPGTWKGGIIMMYNKSRFSLN